MANIKSAVKRSKQAEVSRQRNRSVKSGILTSRKKVLDAIASGNKEEAAKLFRAYT